MRLQFEASSVWPGVFIAAAIALKMTMLSSDTLRLCSLVSVAGTGAEAGFCTAGGREGHCDAAFFAAAALATFSLALL